MLEKTSEQMENKSNKNYSKMTYNQKMCLNAVSRINLCEKGEEKDGMFDSDRYTVYVRGDGGSDSLPHFHIKHKTEGWDIRMNTDGSFHSIKTKSQNRQNSEDFKDIEEISLIWIKLPNCLEPEKTNGKVVETEWIRNN